MPLQLLFVKRTVLQKIISKEIHADTYMYRPMSEKEKLHIRYFQMYNRAFHSNGQLEHQRNFESLFQLLYLLIGLRHNFVEIDPHSVKLTSSTHSSYIMGYQGGITQSECKNVCLNLFLAL